MSKEESINYSIDSIESGPLGQSSSGSSAHIGGDTFSVDSSIRAYRTENGRTYHAYREGVYWAPNDDRQNEELDIAHQKFLDLLDGKLHLAPLSQDIERALDLGCGTGIWAIDFADQYPSTTILGVDLSPIQPSLVPPNCIFEVDDVRDVWTYPVDHFDFIHIRHLLGSIPDWPALYAQIYKHLKPGQWFEHVEYGIDMKSDDGSLLPDSAIVRASLGLKAAGEINGQTFDIFHQMRKFIEEAGFVNIVDRVWKDPLGGWSTDPKLRELGRWTMLGLEIGLEGYSLAMLTRHLNWSVAEVQVLLAQYRRELKDPSIHAYHDIRIIYCQKPSSQ